MRGRIGAYVKTSNFVEMVQREILVDSYPILPIIGRELAEDVNHMVLESGLGSASDLLGSIEPPHVVGLLTPRS